MFLIHRRRPIFKGMEHVSMPTTLPGTQSRQGCVGRQRQALAGEVINHRQDAKTPTVSEAV